MATSHFITKILRHKFLAGFILLMILSGGYFIYKRATTVPAQTRYVLASVNKGTLVVSVSGSGQVSVSDQVEVKPKTAGEIVAVSVAEGQRVAAGAVIAQIDRTDAERAVRDAQIELETAELNFDKIKRSSGSIDRILDDAFADISNGFLDFPAVITTTHDVIMGNTVSGTGQDNQGYYFNFVPSSDYENTKKIEQFVASADADYRAARKDYDAALLAYKNATRSSGQKIIEDLLTQTLATAKSLAQVLKSEQNLFDFLTDYASGSRKQLSSVVVGYKSSLRTYIGQINSHISNLATQSNAIENAPFDIRAQEITIKQRETSLEDLQAALSDYTVRAPFGGVIASLDVKKGDNVSSGTILANLISPQYIAEIALNEVDIAKIALGQKATLTFDAAPELTISGTVKQIDSLGTVSQGVVTYKVQIAFDIQSASSGIKPGMSVSAAVITDVRPDVLLIPNSALKAAGQDSYVEILPMLAAVDSTSASAGVTSAVPPSRQPVEIGVSNDTFTQIISGLKEGDQVVSRTIASSTAAAAPATGGIGGIRIPGVTGGGNRAVGR